MRLRSGNRTGRQDLAPKRLALALAAGLLSMSLASQGAVSLTGPYWADPWDGELIGPGDLNRPDLTLYVGAGEAGSFSVLAGSQVALAGLRLGSRAEAHAVFDGFGTRVSLHGDGNTARLEVGHNAAKASLTVSGGAVLDGRADAASCLLGLRYCSVSIGSSAGSDATLNVIGQGSRASFLGHFGVGGVYVDPAFDFGTAGASTTGRVQVLAGGLLETDTATVGSSHSSAWATGTEQSHAFAHVAGPGSAWRITGNTLDAYGDSFFNLALGGRSMGQAGVFAGGLLQVKGMAGRNYDIRVGNGGTASLTVAGAGSQVRLEGDADRGALHIAEGGGSGVLTVRDGATLSSTARWATVGERGGDGRFTIVGAGSTAALASGSVLSLGDFGTGRLEVLNGASLSTGQLNVGRQQEGRGSVLLDGAGSRLTLDGAGMERLYIGNGDLTVSNGALLDGRVNASACGGDVWCGNVIGAHAGANGSLTVTGTGSRASFLGEFQAGFGAAAVTELDGFSLGVPGATATATVQVLKGGILQADRLRLGLGTYNLGVTGTETVQANLFVRGAGSAVQVTGGNGPANFSTVVWNAKNTSVNIDVSEGGRLQLLAPTGYSANMNLSTLPGMTEFRVRGAGSTLELNSDVFSWLFVGSSGTARLSFSEGAQALGLEGLYVGSSGGQGWLSFDGPGTRGQLTRYSTISLGRNEGHGQLSISNGAVVASDASTRLAQLYVGRGLEDSGGSGLLSISGAGSALNLHTAAAVDGVTADTLFNPRVVIGDQAYGVVRISAGGRMTVRGDVAPQGDGAARYTQLNVGGYVAGGTGLLSVTGAGSRLAVQGQDAVIWVGNGSTGMGQMQVLDGARVDSTLLHLGNIGGTGTLKLDAAEIHLDGQWSSADFGAALVLGKGAGSVGTAHLSRGAKLLISNPGSAGAELNLGGTAQQPRGTGVLALSGGSLVKLEAGPGLAAASIGHSGVGTATLESGSRLDVGDGALYIGRLAGAAGTLVVAGNSSVVAGYLGVGSVPGSDGGIGTLVVSDSTVSAQTIEVGAMGRIGGNGTLVGNVINRGVIGPGNSPGTLTIAGSFANAAGGRIELEVASDGHGSFITDKLLFADGAALDLAELRIDFRFLGATDPNAFQASGGFQLASFFATSGGASLDPALFASASYAASADAYVFQSFSFTADGGATFAAAPVPEPGQWLMLLAGLALLAGWSRRRLVRE